MAAAFFSRFPNVTYPAQKMRKELCGRNFLFGCKSIPKHPKSKGGETPVDTKIPPIVSKTNTSTSFDRYAANKHVVTASKSFPIPIGEPVTHSPY